MELFLVFPRDGAHPGVNGALSLPRKPGMSLQVLLLALSQLIPSRPPIPEFLLGIPRAFHAPGMLSQPQEISRIHYPILPLPLLCRRSRPHFLVFSKDFLVIWRHLADSPLLEIPQSRRTPIPAPLEANPMVLSRNSTKSPPWLPPLRGFFPLFLFLNSLSGEFLIDSEAN